MLNMREAWTDERLDDFARSVDARFDRVEARFDRVEGEIRDLLGEMNAKFERVEKRIDDLNQTIMRLGGGALITFAVGFAGLIATQL